MQVSEPDSTGRVQDSFLHSDQQGQARTAGWATLPGLPGQARRPSRWWLHGLLFVLTLATTTVFGSALATSFSGGRPLSEDLILDGYVRLLRGDWGVWAGAAYSVPLLLILLAHELGHYFTCRRWHVDASLPYFGPAPTLLGTVGAFIRIRSPIYNRRSLFDIGVSGPLAGFVLVVPFLLVGVSLSRVVHGVQASAPVTFGTPLLLRAVEQLRFPGVATADISLHPMAMAAWAGLLATAINLLPVGQLDGGHISYALLGERGHRVLSGVCIASVALSGLLYSPWGFWAIIMFFLRRHPLIYDEESLGVRRRMLAVAALVLFVSSMCLIPVR